MEEPRVVLAPAHGPAGAGLPPAGPGQGSPGRRVKLYMEVPAGTCSREELVAEARELAKLVGASEVVVRCLVPGWTDEEQGWWKVGEG